MDHANDNEWNVIETYVLPDGLLRLDGCQIAESLIDLGLVTTNGMSRSSAGGADCSHEEAGAPPHR